MIEYVFYKALIDWYHQVKRDLPWRKSFSPYTVWLSEIMLQQTQVITVIDYFNRFLEKYPTIQDLAGASEDEVFKLWEGLGYYSRARNLLNCARVVTEQYQGLFPKDLKALLKLPGIGPYTAGAIMSIAYEEPIPAVDGNVMRVMSRYNCMEVDISDTKNRRYFEEAVKSVIGGNPRDFNQALMELGATVCTPKNPKCEACPISANCRGFQTNTMIKYPIKLKKTKQNKVNIAFVVLEHQGELLFVKRPNEGLMPNLWAFPIVELKGQGLAAEVQEFMMEEFHIAIEVKNIEIGKRHVFTHLIWEIQLVRCSLRDKNDRNRIIDFPETTWISLKKTHEYAFPTAVKKQFKLIE